MVVRHFRPREQASRALETEMFQQKREKDHKKAEVEEIGAVHLSLEPSWRQAAIRN